MNRVTLIGGLVRDPEIKNIGNGKALARFTLGVRRDKAEESDYIGCLAFNETAELIGKSLKKGSRVAIEGKIQTGSYDNNEGKKVYTTDIIVNRIEFLDRKPTAPQGKTNSEIIREVVESGPELPF